MVLNQNEKVFVQIHVPGMLFMILLLKLYKTDKIWKATRNRHPFSYLSKDFGEQRKMSKSLECTVGSVGVRISLQQPPNTSVSPSLVHTAECHSRGLWSDRAIGHQ